jgi:hypothetical protein
MSFIYASQIARIIGMRHGAWLQVVLRVNDSIGGPGIVLLTVLF